MRKQGETHLLLLLLPLAVWTLGCTAVSPNPACVYPHTLDLYEGVEFNALKDISSLPQNVHGFVHGLDLLGNGLNLTAVMGGDTDSEAVYLASEDGQPVEWTTNTPGTNADLTNPNQLRLPVTVPLHAAYADFNQDGPMDMVMGFSSAITSYEGGFDGGSTKILNNFELPFGYTYLYLHELYDVDMDGDRDLVVASYQTSGVRITWFENEAHNGTFKMPGHQIGASNPPSSVTFLFVQDMDNDGDADVVFISSNQIHYTVNQGGNPPTWSSFTAVSEDTQQYRVWYADINNDGLMDLLYCFSNDDEFGWIPNTGSVGSPSFGARVVVQSGNSANGAWGIRNIDWQNDGTADDMAVAVRYNHRVQVWVNTDGAGTFSAQSCSTSFLFVGYLAVGDVNQDGFPDIVGTSTLYTSWSVRYFRNVGGTSCIEEQEISLPQTSTSQYPYQILLEDMDGDGYPELMFNPRSSSSSGGASNYYIYANLGQLSGPSFTETASATVTTYPGFASAGGLGAGGGAPVALVTASGTSIRETTVAAYVPSSRFTFGDDFRTISTTRFGDWQSAMVAEDLDNDGDIDLMACNDVFGLAVFVNRMVEDSLPPGVNLSQALDLESPQYIRPSILDVRSTDTFDINGDGRLDVLLATYDNGVLVMRNDGSMTFTDLSVYGGRASVAKFADMNHDGYQDVIFSTGRHLLWVPYLNDSGTFDTSDRVTVQSYYSTSDFVVGLIDDDPYVDVMMEPMVLVLNRGDASGRNWFFPREGRLGNEGGDENGFYLADMNEDGLLDVVHAGENRQAFYANLGKRTYFGDALPASESGTCGAKSVVVMDFDGDSFADVVAAYACDARLAMSPNPEGYWPGGLDIEFEATLNHAMTDMRAYDIDTDGLEDLFGTTSNGSLVWLENEGSAPYFSADLKYEHVVLEDAVAVVGTSPSAVAAADLDHVQGPDLVVGGGDTLVWLRSTDATKGEFAAPLEVGSSSDCGAYNKVEAVDMDNDGWRDLVVQCTLSPNRGILWFRNNMAGDNVNTSTSWAAPVMIFSDFVPRDFAVGDLDADGWMDVVAVTASDVDQPIAWMRNDGGAFSPSRTWRLNATAPPVVPQGISACALGDWDFDGYPDLVVYPEGTSSDDHVAQYHNELGVGGVPASGDDAYVGFRDVTVRSLLPGGSNNDAWSLQFADLNHDGILDMASGWTMSRRAYTWAARNNWIKRPTAPRTLRVDVERCGYTVACINEAIVRASHCAEDTVLVPEGTYRGCMRLRPLLIQKSLWLQGEKSAVTVDCEPLSPQTSGGRFLWKVGAETSLTLTGMVFDGVFTDPATFGGGVLQVGGVAYPNGQLTMRNCTVRNSYASTSSVVSVKSPSVGFAPALMVEDETVVLVEDCLFEDNYAEHSAGAIAFAGANIDATLRRVDFIGNYALQTGGAVFVEQAVDGHLSLTFEDVLFSESRVIGVAQDPTKVAMGGALAIFCYVGTMEVTMNNTRFFNNTAIDQGGAVMGVTLFEAELVLHTENVVFQDNAAFQGDGGAMFLEARDESRIELHVHDGTVWTSNTSPGVGGALAMRVLSQDADDGTTPTGLVRAEGSVIVSHNSAQTLGGGWAILQSDEGGLVGVPVTVDIGDGVLFRDNSARLFGGAVALSGIMAVDVGAATFRSNSATFGAAVSSLARLGMLENEGSGMGTNSASLPLATGSVDGCAPGTTTNVHFSGTTFAVNQAAYGGLVFTCESLIRMTSVTSLSVDGSHGGYVGGGLAFMCAPVLDCDGAGNPCCRGANDAVTLGAPWLQIDAATEAAVNASLSALDVNSLGGSLASYGRVVATPATRMTWKQRPPAAVSTGIPLRTASVELEDAMDQYVLDPTVIVEAVFTNAAGDDHLFAGGSRSLLLTLRPLSFAELAIGTKIGAPIGQNVDMALRLQGSVVPQSSPLFPSVAATVRVDACLPGAGVLLEPGAQVYECALCQDNFFSNQTGLQPCEECPGTNFLTGVGATKCFSCPEGTGLVDTTIDPENGVNCTCIAGYWDSRQIYNVACQPCPTGGVCEGGTQLPYPAPGYFPTDEEGVFLPCPTPVACEGGYPFQCARGYEGRLCAACQKGFYTLNNYCYKCDNRTIPLLTVVFLLAVAFVAFLVYLNSKEELTYRFAAVMIGFNSLQITGMYGKLDLPWSGFARQFMEIISFLNFNLDLSSPECASFTQDVWLLKWIVTVLLPLLIMIPFVCACSLFLLYAKQIAPRIGRSSDYTVGVLFDASCRAYFQVITLMYLPLAATSMSFFQCSRGKDGRYVLDAAPAKQCSGWWWTWMPVAIVFSLVYAVGIPSFVFGFLTRMRNNAEREDSLLIFNLRYSFLVGRFKELNYRWEVSIMLRKLGVVVAMVAFQGHNTKANVAILLLNLSLMQLGRYMPYLSKFHNFLALICLGSCICVLWAVTFSQSDLRDGCVMAAILVNILAIIIGNIIDLVLIYRREAEAEKDFLEEQCDEAYQTGELDHHNTFNDSVAFSVGFADNSNGNNVEMNSFGTEGLQTFTAADTADVDTFVVSGQPSPFVATANNPVFADSPHTSVIMSGHNFGSSGGAFDSAASFATPPPPMLNVPPPPSDPAASTTSVPAASTTSDPAASTTSDPAASTTSAHVVEPTSPAPYLPPPVPAPVPAPAPAPVMPPPPPPAGAAPAMPPPPAPALAPAPVMPAPVMPAPVMPPPAVAAPAMPPPPPPRL